jgi:uncharacterized protein (TIGR02145 family)
MALVTASGTGAITVGGLTAGTHTLYVTDKCGAIEQPFTITNSDGNGLLLLATATDIIRHCDGTSKAGSITLTASGGVLTASYQYSIDGGVTWPTFPSNPYTLLVSKPGNFLVELRDGSGCTFSVDNVVVGEVELCNLIACDKTDKTVTETTCDIDYYIHADNSWDIVPVPGITFDDVKYILNGTIEINGPGATLNGVTFNNGTTAVKGIAFYGILTDTCEFNVIINLTVTSTPADPVIVSDPFPAYQGVPVDLSLAVDMVSGVTYTYYANSDGTGALSGSVITFIPPKDDYYVKASIGSCESQLVKITLKDPCPSSVWDTETNEYKVTSLGGYCWTENLKSTVYFASGDPIKFAKPYTCPICPAQLDTIFGLLYTWYSAVNEAEPTKGTVQGICPDGWHIPSIAEWSSLNAYPASQLRSTKYWLSPLGPGTDNYGFDARPAGWYNGVLERFEDLYGFAGWWASDDLPGITTAAHYFWIFFFNDTATTEIYTEHDGLSVRCVMDY